MPHELLAPAGNIEAGYAALYYGADAVYLGLNKFSARAGAENFTFEELNEFTAYAHFLHRKVFVALNTILTEEEVLDLPEIFSALQKACVDALIIQDFGVFYLARRLLPDIELHASTQMAVHNAEGARFLYRLGFKRVVLARELTAAEIRTIAQAVPEVDLEVFVHGALCYSYSGQCLFSALEYGKSANRGRCAYPCRSLFNGAAGMERGHFFSMKDLALEEEVLNIPALSLKIEGRKKSPLYVAAVTDYYRHILDGKKKNPQTAENIKQIFSRPWCRFHFNGRCRDVTDEEFVGHRGLIIGQAEKIAHGRLIFKTARTIARYDGIQIDSGGREKPFGFGIKSLYAGGKSCFEVKAGQTAEVELPKEHPHITLGAPVYLASSSAVKGMYDYVRPKAGEFKHRCSYQVRVVIEAETIRAESAGEVVSTKGVFAAAKDAAKVTETVKAAFAKTGGTDILFNDVQVINPEGRFAPVSLLNDLRRQLVEKLQLKTDERKIELPELKAWNLKAHTPLEIHIRTISYQSKADDFTAEERAKCWFLLPQICRQVSLLAEVVEQLYQAGVRRFAVDNCYGFELLKPYKDIQIAAGSFVYVMNRYAAAQLAEMGVVWAMPAVESSLLNTTALVKSSPLPLVQMRYGFLPLFTSAVCIRRRTCRDCQREELRMPLCLGGREYVAVSKDCQTQVFAKEPYEREPVDGIYGFVDSRCDEDKESVAF